MTCKTCYIHQRPAPKTRGHVVRRLTPICVRSGTNMRMPRETRQGAKAPRECVRKSENKWKRMTPGQEHTVRTKRGKKAPHKSPFQGLRPVTWTRPYRGREAAAWPLFVMLNASAPRHKITTAFPRWKRGGRIPGMSSVSAVTCGIYGRHPDTYPPPGRRPCVLSPGRFGHLPKRPAQAYFGGSFRAHYLWQNTQKTACDFRSHAMEKNVTPWRPFYKGFQTKNHKLQQFVTKSGH